MQRRPAPGQLPQRGPPGSANRAAMKSGLGASSRIHCLAAVAVPAVPARRAAPPPRCPPPELPARVRPGQQFPGPSERGPAAERPTAPIAAAAVGAPPPRRRDRVPPERQPAAEPPPKLSPDPVGSTQLRTPPRAPHRRRGLPAPPARRRPPSLTTTPLTRSHELGRRSRRIIIVDRVDSSSREGTKKSARRRPRATRGCAARSSLRVA